MRILNRRARHGGRLPDLVVIGAAKAGTSSLHHYLNQHPRVSMSREKELHFFVRERNWDRGIAWYRSHFGGESDLCGESSPGYAIHPIFRGVPKRMRRVIPDARLIYILRDPIERIRSHYMHNVSDGGEQRSFEAATEGPKRNRYVAASRYFHQLRQYLECYPPSRIHILTLEDLIRSPVKTMTEVFRFLGVDPSFSTPRFEHVLNDASHLRRKTRVGMGLKRLSRTRAGNLFTTDFRRAVGRILYRPFSRPIPRPVLSPSLESRLRDLLRDDVDGLRRYTGRGFRAWSI